MKNLLFILSLIGFTTITNAQEITGAWEAMSTGANGDPLRTVVIITDNYNVMTTYDAKTGKFINTMGGSWEMDGDQLAETIEFHSQDPSLVGQQQQFQVIIDNDTMEIPELGMTLSRLDDGSEGALNGSWLMSGRVRDGVTQSRDTTRPRKTMKILSGKRFQWIAYNTETKEFMGTGGGTYSTIDGKYMENIEFFSKDDSRVGASLEFDFELKNNDWHHSGLSSKGDPIYEIWSIRN